MEKGLAILCSVFALLLPSLSQAQSYRLAPLPPLPQKEYRFSLEVEDERAELEYDVSDSLTTQFRLKKMEGKRAAILGLFLQEDGHLSLVFAIGVKD